MFKKNAFSMIELAIVIAVLSILMSGSFEASKYLLQQNKIKSTNLKLNAIQNAIDIFVIENGRLPCPASYTTTTGKEAASCSSASTGIYYNNTTASGAVPYATLGLTSDMMYDAWKNKIIYSVNSTTATINTSTSSVSGVVRLVPKTARIKIYNNSNTSANLITSEAAYTLLSPGKDRVPKAENKVDSSALNLKVYIADKSNGDDLLRYKTRMQILFDTKMEDVYCYVNSDAITRLKSLNGNATMSFSTGYLAYNSELTDTTNKYKLKCFKYGRLGVYKYE